MLTGEDIDRLHEDHAKVGKKLMVIETMQFFEIEIPTDIDPEEYLITQECRDICADKIKSGITDLEIDRMMYHNPDTGEFE